jgi:hypothetical protein
MKTSSLAEQSRIYSQWLLACSLGVPIGWAVGRGLAFALGYVTGIYKLWALGFVLGPVVTGLVVGWAQWRVLRSTVSRSRQWIGVTALGWAIGSAITLFVGNWLYGIVNLALLPMGPLAAVWGMSGAISGAISGTIGGALAGSVQWGVLRRTLPQARRWIGLSSVGWAMSTGAMAALDRAAVGPIGLGLSWVVYGAIYGLITGLMWEVESRKSEVGNRKSEVGNALENVLKA